MLAILPVLLILAGWSGRAGASPSGPSGSAAAGGAGPGSPAPTGWLEQAQRDLQEREYEVSWQASPVVEEIDPAWHAPNRAHGFRTYFTVASPGDINGDGYSDVIVGADFYDNGQTDEGRAFVYLGSSSGLSLTPS